MTSCLLPDPRRKVDNNIPIKLIFAMSFATFFFAPSFQVSLS